MSAALSNRVSRKTWLHLVGVTFKLPARGYRLVHRRSARLWLCIARPFRFATEFMADSQEISRGVVIGQPGANQLLEDNKVAFIASFVQRSRFSSAFATSLTPAQFVDALFVNAGVTPSASDRTAAINEFGGAPNTADTAARGRALRRVAENSLLNNAEKSKAFV